MENYSDIELKAGILFFQGKKTKLDYAGYCCVIQQVADLYLQLLYDYLERIPNARIADHAIAIGNLMVELQQMLSPHYPDER
ncbi:MAG: hypothetical protein NW224_30100 [Leptolyngbyaceae cyanobacterium bins.302]|nr:hypothetical protein [Leptolyngbyaceae cyanobacterium bins.302]